MLIHGPNGVKPVFSFATPPMGMHYFRAKQIVKFSVYRFKTVEEHDFATLHAPKGRACSKGIDTYLAALYLFTETGGHIQKMMSTNLIQTNKSIIIVNIQTLYKKCVFL